ncbi:unnamed protein product [Adineta steineri]|uniref:Uncharacterized protein n=1 Tax=Adineta steineri TaxID=433720 RepID=A0A819FN71_9BILA|nr:unnamed protein product [Adineta steineri]
MATTSTPVRLLIVGMNAEMNSKITAGLNDDKSISAHGFIVSNDSKSDAELINVIKEKKHDVIILGGGLRSQEGWLERIDSIVKENTDVHVLEINGRTVDAVKEALHVNGILKG